MLTREMAIATIEDGRLIPDRLTKHADACYLELANVMCDIYSNGRGRTRRELHREIQRVMMEAPRCLPRRAEAFCKLLDEASTYDRDARGAAARLRRQVFRIAAQFHPLVLEADSLFESEEQHVKHLIAKRLDEPWANIKKKLFKDIKDFHELIEFQGFEHPGLLLSKYNVAQTQVALFDATRMVVRAQADFKAILRFAKLARLMHRIYKTSWGYEFVFDGPTSLFNTTHRYGVAMARFLPGLLSCRAWSLTATIRRRRRQTSSVLKLDSQSGLSSRACVGPEFDSKVEQAFYEDWKAAPETAPWQLLREAELLHDGQFVFFPDFVFQHPDGRRVLLEIVGFWTPEYLQHKQWVLSRFQNERIILAVARTNRGAFPVSDLHQIVEYKTKLSVRDVLTALQYNGRRTSHFERAD